MTLDISASLHGRGVYVLVYVGVWVCARAGGWLGVGLLIPAGASLHGRG